MIIHVIGSGRKITSDLPYLSFITKLLEAQGHTIALNWFEPTKRRLERGKLKNSEMDWQSIVHNHQTAIKRSDAIIIEASTYNFGHGFLAAQALSQHKPVLFLYRKGANRWHSLNELFISGILDDLFHTEMYANERHLEDIISNFLIQLPLNHSNSKVGILR